MAACMIAIVRIKDAKKKKRKIKEKFRIGFGGNAKDRWMFSHNEDPIYLLNHLLGMEMR